MTTKNERGIGLVETLLAIGIATIIVTSMVSLSIFTLRSSLQNKLTLEGTQLANQEIEQVRAFRDSMAWDEFILETNGSAGSPNCFNAAGCYMGGASSVTSGTLTIGAGTPEELKIRFNLTDQSGGPKTLVRVTVTVSWKLGADTKYAHSYTELSDWRNL